MQRPEFEDMTLAELFALQEEWVKRETRLDCRAARTALLVALKVWDEKDTVKPEAIFPLLNEELRLTPEERERREWDRVKAVIRAATPSRPEVKE